MAAKSNDYEDLQAGKGSKAKTTVPELSDSALYINRGLFWLRFNDGIVD